MNIIALILLGLCFGSFVNALILRLHTRRSMLGRSECESCGHALSPLDLIPIASWIMLRGRCRYCHRQIDWENPAIEATMALLFVGSYFAWPQSHIASWQSWVSFGCWLFYCVALVALFVYDLKWMLLPNVIVFPLIAVGLFDAWLRTNGVPSLFVEHILFGALALGGVYWILYIISKGSWVGYGDVKLGLFMGIVLGWQEALAVLFLANLIGFLVVLPGMLTGSLTRKSRVPFGPFLTAAFIIVGLFGQRLLATYLSFVLRP